MKYTLKIARIKNFVYFDYDTSEFKEHIISFELKFTSLIALKGPEPDFPINFQYSFYRL